MSWKKSSLVNARKSESLSRYIDENKLGSKIIEIFEDILETEVSKDYLTIDHNKRKVHFNMSISTEERIHLSNMMSILYPKKEIHSPFCEIFPMNSSEIEGVRINLETKGFHVFDSLLSAAVCDHLVNGIESVTFHTKKSTKKIKGISKDTVGKINGNTAWATNQQDILSIEEVQKIAFDENLLNLVGSFLGSEPILCQTNCWWSVANSTHRSNLSTNAQLFHQDTEYLKFVKVFIYLTDVNDDNGPHQYVQGTSKIAQSKLGEDYKPSNRVEDNKVAEIFGVDNILTFTGKRGSVIIEDTFGLHKGTPVVEGSRLLLQLEYCNSLYFHSGYSFGFENLEPEVEKLAETNPRIFSNFTNQVALLNEKKFQFFNNRTFTQKVKDKIKSYL
ncbi:MAG: phytanoyl-CoA dioxygenase family protein [Polaribacter sp.]